MEKTNPPTVKPIPVTGNPEADFVLEAGPRAFTPSVSKAARLELAKLDPDGPWRGFLKSLAREQVIQIWADIDHIGYQHAHMDWKAVRSGLGLPYARFPLSMVALFKEMYGEECWPDEEFMEDTLKHHPELRVPVRYGTRGQEYGGRRAVLSSIWNSNFLNAFRGKT